jgi:2-polyprenyl-3-methyl-5-hydroxy-6-metoxy-1,4-benzoquinol methylase
MAHEMTLPEQIVCPTGIAGHVGTRQFQKSTWTFYRCQVCAHLWIHPIPTEGELEAFYDKGYFQGDPTRHGYVDYDNEKRNASPYFNRLLDMIATYHPVDGALLDVGAATGFFVALAAERGWKARGVELSSYAVSVAKSRGLDVVQGTFEQNVDLFKQIDVVTMWDLVEHLRDPFTYFRLLRPAVAVTGILAFATPQSDSLFARFLGRWWTLLAPPQHIHYFSRQSLKICLEQAGFELVDIKRFGKEFTLAYIAHFVLGWFNVEWRWLKALANWKLLQRMSIRLNTYDYMRLVIAKPRRSK